MRKIFFLYNVLFLLYVLFGGKKLRKRYSARMGFLISILKLIFQKNIFLFKIRENEKWLQKPILKKLRLFYGCWNKKLWSCNVVKNVFFFLLGFSFTDTDNSQWSRGRQRTIFYFTLPFPPAHEHSDIYLQLCMWDDYHMFLVAPLVFTRLLLDEIYHLIEIPFDWLVMLHLFVCVMICY